MSERWFPDSMPQPMVDKESLPWWQAAAQHRLTVQCCDNCQYCRLPPAPICSECQSNKSHWEEISGKGTLYSYTEVHRAVATGQTLPFVIAIIQLDMDGIGTGNSVRIMSNIVDANPDELEIGKAVSVAWETMSDTVSLPRFKLLSSS